MNSTSTKSPSSAMGTFHSASPLNPSKYKLVRDHIPELKIKDGEKPEFYRATDDEYPRYLHDKLREEVEEFIDSLAVEELADVVEVIDELISHYQIDRAMLKHIQHQKAKKKGQFKARFLLKVKS